MSKRVKDILKRSQRGFTLIELIAVMGIMAVLVAVVAPAVTGTRDASIRARVQTDAQQVTTAISDFYADQNEAETTTPHTIAVGAIGVPATGEGSVQQFVSNRWPEKFITENGSGAVAAIGDLYATEFESVAAPVDVRSVTLVGATAAELLAMTALDLPKLVAEGYLEKLPEGANLTTDFTVTVSGTEDPSASVKVHNFLWLLEKSSTAGGAVANDLRDVVVFQLDATEIIETPETAEGAFAVELTYKKIL